jgi:dihydrofolate synthase/folylpolyglutamate synthase
VRFAFCTTWARITLCIHSVRGEGGSLSSIELSYQHALDFIFSYVDYEKQARFTYDGATLNLDRMERLLELLGHPERSFRSVHIAGTKGKGSTASMLEAILRAAGLRTGLYTSPHLHTFRERIRVGGQLVTRQELVDLVETCRPAIEAVPGITTFEIITALGFEHFAQAGVEWAVVEVGLGGRLDATNVVQPELTAITTLGLDHTYLLGNTLALIAREKAGIIKPGVPLVCAPQEPEAMAVIEEVCAKQRAELILVGRDWVVQQRHADKAGQSLCIREMAGDSANAVGHDDLWIPLLGQFQLINATMAVAVAETLRRHGLGIPEAAVRDGLAHTRWPGRVETLRERPRVVVDCAHNPHAIAQLAAALGQSFPRERLLLVYGASADKDIASMLDILLPLSEIIIMTQTRHPRAASPHKLAQMASTRLRDGQLLGVATNVEEAMDFALNLARPADLICATGSVFLVGEAREAFAEFLPADDWAHQAEPALSVR